MSGCIHLFQLVVWSFFLCDMKRWWRTSPCLTAGIGSFFCFGLLLMLDLPPESVAFRLLVGLWQTVGFGPHYAANLLAFWWPTLPGWLDACLIVLLGLLPYILADRLLGYFRRWRQRRATADQ